MPQKGNVRLRHTHFCCQSLRGLIQVIAKCADNGPLDTRTAQIGSVILPAMAGAAEMSDISFAPIIARGMAYYTGLSFEIYTQGIDRPIAAGGRYDDLLQSLGAPQALSAIGGAIALERLNKAVEMQS